MNGRTAISGIRIRSLGAFVLAGLFASGCSTIQGGAAAAAKGFEDFRQGLRDAQTERDLQAQRDEDRAAREREQAERDLEKSDPQLYRIRQRWKELKPRYQGPRFAAAPRTAAPYAAGELSGGFLEDGLNMTRFVRFLAGVPADVELSRELCAQAQHGAVVLAALSQLTHNPQKPAGMDEEFYSLGLASTRSSNIRMSGGPDDTLAAAVIGFMDDSDQGNIDRVGHRRWVLSPRLKRLGFGMALSSGGEAYTTMQVFDAGNAGASFDLITWPAEGSFPLEFFNSAQAWSVSYNPDRLSRAGELRVRLTRGADHWDLSERDTNPEGTYLHVDTGGYGYQSTIIFKPGAGLRIQAGDSFSVSLSGLRSKDGKQRNVDYTVTFVRLSDSPF